MAQQGTGKRAHSPAGRGEANEQRTRRARQEEEEPADLRPGAHIEHLPDELLCRVLLQVGARAAFGLCRVVHVSRRWRAVASTLDWPELALVAGVQRKADDASPGELRRTLMWFRSGRLRLQSLRVDIAVDVEGFTPDFWTGRGSGQPPCISALSSLRRLSINHGDVVARIRNSDWPSHPTYDEYHGGLLRTAEEQDEARVAYVARLLESTRPAAATLEELSIDLPFPSGRPGGACADSFHATLASRLPPLAALRRLDLRFCDLDAEVVRLLAAACPRLAALRARAVDDDEDLPVLAATMAACMPLLEELAIDDDGAVLPQEAGTALGSLPRLRRLELNNALDRGVVAAFATALRRPSPLERLRITLQQQADAEDARALAQLAVAAPALASVDLALGLSEARPEVGPALVAALGRLPALTVLRLTIAGSSAVLGPTFEALAALPALPSLRSLCLSVQHCEEEGPAAAAPPSAERALRAAAGAVAAYERFGTLPPRGEAEALAGCARLRSAMLAPSDEWEAVDEAAALQRLAPLAALPRPPEDADGEREAWRTRLTSGPQPPLQLVVGFGRLPLVLRLRAALPLWTVAAG